MVFIVKKNSVMKRGDVVPRYVSSMSEETKGGSIISKAPKAIEQVNNGASSVLRGLGQGNSLLSVPSMGKPSGLMQSPFPIPSALNNLKHTNFHLAKGSGFGKKKDKNVKLKIT